MDGVASPMKKNVQNENKDQGFSNNYKNKNMKNRKKDKKRSRNQGDHGNKKRFSSFPESVIVITHSGIVD